MISILGLLGVFLLFVALQVAYFYYEERQDRRNGIPPTTFRSKLRWGFAETIYHLFSAF